jgi:hypothetical protein
MKFDMREVEELIDNDFLNLDEFIFKVKWFKHIIYQSSIFIIYYRREIC